MPETNIPFPKIAHKIRALDLLDFDIVIGIATGGIVLASLVAFYTELDLKIIHLNYRAKDNSIKYAEPKLLKDFSLDKKYKNILLVDDVSVSGETFAKAKGIIKQQKITTLAIKGKADIVLFENIDTCISLAWRDY